MPVYCDKCESVIDRAEERTTIDDLDLCLDCVDELTATRVRWRGFIIEEIAVDNTNWELVIRREGSPKILKVVGTVAAGRNWIDAHLRHGCK